MGKEVINMKEFFNPEQARFLYPEIIPVYQTAFAGEPWFEVSKCADDAEIKRCVGEFSALTVGQTCEMCGNCPIRSAYEKDELIERFESLAATRPTAWYLEGNELGITLAAVAWKKTPAGIAKERYLDNQEMSDWMISKLGNDNIVWLDEIFADKSKKPSGNLTNFRNMCVEFLSEFGESKLAFRTINTRLEAAALRDFESSAQLFQRETDVPDRRDFVTINCAAVSSSTYR